MIIVAAVPMKKVKQLPQGQPQRQTRTYLNVLAKNMYLVKEVANPQKVTQISTMSVSLMKTSDTHHTAQMIQVSVATT